MKWIILYYFIFESITLCQSQKYLFQSNWNEDELIIKTFEKKEENDFLLKDSINYNVKDSVIYFGENKRYLFTKNCIHLNSSFVRNQSREIWGDSLFFKITDEVILNKKFSTSNSGMFKPARRIFIDVFFDYKLGIEMVCLYTPEPDNIIYLYYLEVVKFLNTTEKYWQVNCQNEYDGYIRRFYF